MFQEDRKKCNTCGYLRPMEEFHRDKSRKDGRKNKCKECTSSYDRERNAQPLMVTARFLRRQSAEYKAKQRIWDREYMRRKRARQRAEQEAQQAE